LKFICLKHDEIKYCATLDWDSMMSYLEKRYGVLYKNEFKKRLVNQIQKLEAGKQKREN